MKSVEKKISTEYFFLKKTAVLAAATVFLALVGAVYFALSLFFGFASAPRYDSILAASLKMGLFSTGIFSVNLAISKWKHRWLFLIPILLQILNAFQALERLKR